jgi:SMI1 / KNR4 family (SUKH-1)
VAKGLIVQFEDIVSKWASMKSLKLNPGISHDELNSFSHEFSLSFPKDFCEYLAFCNGFLRVESDSFENLDDNAFDFLPFEANRLVAGRWFVFCEWPYSLIKYAILLDDSKRAGLVAIFRELDEAFVLCDSFSKFLDLYFFDDPALYKISGEEVSLV